MSPKKKFLAIVVPSLCGVYLLGGVVLGLLSHDTYVTGPYWVFGMIALLFTELFLLIGFDG